MIAFDSDVLGLSWLQKEPYASRALAIPSGQRGIPVVVAEKLLRGRLDQVRKAESGRTKLSLSDAYHFLELTLDGLRGGIYLPFTPAAASFVAGWKLAKLQVKAMDMRIAAIAIANDATLVTRNARDFKLVPGLKLDIWS